MIKFNYSEESSIIFDSFFKNIFKKHKQIEYVKWTQYTPYMSYIDDMITFNTIFKSNIELVEIKLTKDDLFFEIKNEITSFLSKFDDEFYLRKFGNHAEILVKKDSVDISDYEHD